MLIDHSKLLAYALCWPGDPRPLLYETAALAEENRKWFASNYKNDRNGKPRGEPFVLTLCVRKDAQQSIE